MLKTAVVLLVAAVCLFGSAAHGQNLRSFAPPSVEHTPYWELTSTVPAPSEHVTWKVYLKVRNTEELAALALAVADPASPRYGQLVDLEYLRSRFNPTVGQVEAVLEWIQQQPAAEGHSVLFVPAGRQYIRLVSTVADLESLFHTRFGYYRSLISGQLHLRPVQPYFVPESLLANAVVDYIDQFSELPNQAPATRPAPARAATADSYVEANPDYLINAYKIQEASSAVAGSTTATVQFSGNWYSPSDLQTFFTTYAPPLKGQTPCCYYGVNANAPPTVSKPSLESNLDQQYIMSIGRYVNSSIYYVVPSNGIEEGFVEYATYVNNQPVFPFVQSISYGQYGGQYTNATVQRLDAELQQAGLRGYTGLLASGDNGVGGKCSSGQCVSFEFDFPSSPHFTMVGATQFVTVDGSDVEQAAQLSAGGFSLDYYRPSWQNSAVLGYFNSGVALPPASLYYANGRGYPDISACGQDVVIIDQGKPTQVSGTSCSAPITGGIFALLNNYRIANGKSPLGWLNPLLYANPSALNDITTGGPNKYCPALGGCCCPGFQEAKGWSPVTGLGSPNYPKLLAVVQALP